MIMPNLIWVLFQEHYMLGLYTPCCENILLDAINCQGIIRRFHCILHEVIHHLSNFFPSRIYECVSFCLDLTDGNQKELLYEEDHTSTVVLYEFE